MVSNNSIALCNFKKQKKLRCDENFSSHLVDLNKPRPGERRLCDLLRVRERAIASHESRDGEPVEQVLSVGEINFEGGDAVLDIDVVDLLDERRVLAIDEDHGDACLCLRLVDCDGELEGLVIGRDGRGDDVQRLEDW